MRKMCLKYGFDKSRFVDIEDSQLSEFTCGICLGVFNNPFETKCCRQTFCKQCIENWISKSNTCPLDRSLLRAHDLIKSSKIVINLLSKLKIKCDNSDKGCQQVIDLGSLSSHLIVCDFRPKLTTDLEKGKLIRQQLLILIHAHKCIKRGDGDQRCPLPNCPLIKSVLKHMIECSSGLLSIKFSFS